mmetsp:Transcript_85724/g.256769  ORF Transcript_85724/g.256769 Transcript_85724/m.256769 type:complete len:277 (-) Transcript_85724:124-954(-)
MLEAMSCRQLVPCGNDSAATLSTRHLLPAEYTDHHPVQRGEIFKCDESRVRGRLQDRSVGPLRSRRRLHSRVLSSRPLRRGTGLDEPRVHRRLCRGSLLRRGQYKCHVWRLPYWAIQSRESWIECCELLGQSQGDVQSTGRGERACQLRSRPPSACRRPDPVSPVRFGQVPSRGRSRGVRALRKRKGFGRRFGNVHILFGAFLPPARAVPRESLHALQRHRGRRLPLERDDRVARVEEGLLAPLNRDNGDPPLQIKRLPWGRRRGRRWRRLLRRWV